MTLDFCFCVFGYFYIYIFFKYTFSSFLLFNISSYFNLFLSLLVWLPCACLCHLVLLPGWFLFLLFCTLDDLLFLHLLFIVWLLLITPASIITGISSPITPSFYSQVHLFLCQSCDSLVPWERKSCWSKGKQLHIYLSMADVTWVKWLKHLSEMKNTTGKNVARTDKKFQAMFQSSRQGKDQQWSRLLCLELPEEADSSRWIREAKICKAPEDCELLIGKSCSMVLTWLLLQRSTQWSLIYNRYIIIIFFFFRKLIL